MKSQQQGFALLGLGKAILLALTVVGCLSLGLSASTYTVGLAKDFIFPQAQASVHTDNSASCAADF